MKRFKPQIRVTEEHDIPYEVPLTPEQEALNELIERVEELEEQVYNLRFN